MHLLPTLSRILIIFMLLIGVGVASSVSLLLLSKSHIFQFAHTKSDTDTTIAFPVSVNPQTKTISQNPTVDTFYQETYAQHPQSSDNFFNQIAAVFSKNTTYQNLASPVSRIVVVWPGERKEEIYHNIAAILRWNEAEKQEFATLIENELPPLTEGILFPNQYVTHRKATPVDIHTLIKDQFTNSISTRYTPEVASVVPLRDALIIASLLEREASDFRNMREVSGVIWNRLFIDMPLQLDATLQYVRGSKPYEASWWPKVVPADKYLDSPYNTYQNPGLPPGPIANPSAEAVLAALNPVKTDCLFYFHASDGSYFCSKTYQEHVTKLRKEYGRGL